MTTILVGVDGTDRSHDAIALGRDLATRCDAGIVLASAVPFPAFALMGDGVPAAAIQDITQEAEDRLAALAAPLRDAGLAVDRVVGSFSPPHFLQVQAEERRVDLIVVGSTHASRWGRVMPGSTGERLLHGAPCPVAVAPAGYAANEAPAWQRIGVAFDGSEASHAALRAATGLAGRLGAELDVVTVLDAMQPGSPAPMNGPGDDRRRADVEAVARGRLETVLAGLPATVHAAGRLRAGDPAEQLAEASDEYDLMLAGSRGYGPLHAVLLGGVTGRLVRHCACPLIVTPRGVDAPLAAFADLAVSGASGP